MRHKIVITDKVDHNQNIVHDMRVKSDISKITFTYDIEINNQQYHNNEIVADSFNHCHIGYYCCKHKHIHLHIIIQNYIYIYD